MSTSLAQILNELDKSGGYANDRSLLNSQLAALPKQGAAEIKGLDAKLAQANNRILEGSRSRGLGFSGIPLAEQAQYAATEYAPAVARVKQQQESSRLGILQSLNSLERDRRAQGQSIFDNNRSFAEQQRQFNEQMAFQREQQAQAQRAAAQAQQQANAQSYLQAQQAQTNGANAERQKALQAEADRLRKELLAIQNYKPGYTTTKSGLRLPNF